MARRFPDITRIMTLTGWEPRLSLDDITRDVVAFERARIEATGTMGAAAPVG